MLTMTLLHFSLIFLTIICGPSPISHVSILIGIFKTYLPPQISLQHKTSL